MRRLTSGTEAKAYGLGTTIKQRRGAVGIGLGATIIKLRRSTSAAAGIGLGTTIKYLRRTTSAAAGGRLGTTIKYLVNQNAGAGSNWAKVHSTKAGHDFLNPPVL
jgi:hypothetical protein